MDQTSGTIYKAIYKAKSSGRFDYIMRVAELENTDSGLEISFIEETPKFAEKILNPFLENMVLRETVRNLWKTHQYNQEYISFLLSTCTEEEFLAKAEVLSAHFQDISIDQLSFSANLLVDVLGSPLNSAELSLLFNANPNSLNNASSSLLEYNPENIESE